MFIRVPLEKERNNGQEVEEKENEEEETNRSLPHNVTMCDSFRGNGDILS